MIIALLGLIIMAFILFSTGGDTQTMKYSEVIDYFEQGKVSEFVLNMKNGAMQLTLTEEATQELLDQLGAKTDVSPDGDTLTISGPVRLRGGFTADARGDHRMVMLLAAAALIADGPITVTGAECISKSWPGFVDTYRQLGGIAQ